MPWPLMPVLLLMDILGMAAFRKDFDLKLLRFLIPYGLVGIVIGALLFKLLNANTVAGIVGLFTLLFLAQRLLFRPKIDSAPPPKWLGALLKLPVPQRKIIREVILTFAKMHGDTPGASE